MTKKAVEQQHIWTLSDDMQTSSDGNASMSHCFYRPSKVPAAIKAEVIRDDGGARINVSIIDAKNPGSIGVLQDTEVKTKEEVLCGLEEDARECLRRINTGDYWGAARLSELALSDVRISHNAKLETAAFIMLRRVAAAHMHIFFREYMLASVEIKAVEDDFRFLHKFFGFELADKLVRDLLKAWETRCFGEPINSL